MIELIGVGAGGHAQVVIEILRLAGEYKLIGLLESNRALWETCVSGVAVLGGDELLPEIYDRGVHYAFIGVGTVGNAQPRIRLYTQLLSLGFQPIRAIHPSAVISPSVNLGLGLAVMANAVINANAQIGNNVIVNTGAIVEHDCNIGDHVHIATGARLASTVRVGQGSHIGIGATIKQCVHIGQNSVIGAGAVVVEDVPDNVVVAGVPSRILRRLNQ